MTDEKINDIQNWTYNAFRKSLLDFHDSTLVKQITGPGISKNDLVQVKATK